MKKITFKHNADGEIVGVEITEHYTLEELQKHYPRDKYPRQWEQLDKKLPAQF